MAPTDQIKQRIDIVDFIGETVSLKKSGRNFAARCPFHDERTPSFFVFPDRQAWRCFGACASGGDIFSFVMRKEGVGFGEALRVLAKRAGVELPNARVSKDRAAKEEVLKNIVKTAAIFFHDLLMNSEEANSARSYVLGRGISEETIELFRMGYCGRNTEALHRHLLHQEFDDTQILNSGLLRKRDDGSLSNFFGGRLIIPIQDGRSDYIGFGARALDDSKPKYINSSQSAIFEKASVLYGLNRAKDSIQSQGEAVVVEGYMDVITAHQHGYTNVVASMGTALTERQVAALTKLANRFILALDPDDAGNEATLRSLESSWKILDRPGSRSSQSSLTGPDRTSPELYIAGLESGKDPDSLIRENPNLWVAALEHATPVVDYVFEKITGRFDATNSKGKNAITQRLAPLIHNAPNIYEWNARVGKLAQLLKEEEDIVKRAIGIAPARHTTRRLKGVRSGLYTFPEGAKDSLEEYCLASLLRYPELRPLANHLEPGHFLKSHNKEIFDTFSKGIPTEELRDQVDELVLDELEVILSFEFHSAPYQERELGLDECINRLEKRLLHLEHEAVQSRYIEGDLDLAAASALTQDITDKLRLIDERHDDVKRHTLVGRRTKDG